MSGRFASILGVAALCGCALGGNQSGGTAMNASQDSEANKRVIQRFYEEYVNQERAEVLPALFSQSFVDHTNGGVGPEGVAAGVARLHAAFQGLRFEIKDLVAEGDRVAARWVYTGRHVAPFAGRPPTGKAHEQHGQNMFRLEGGKIAELWLTVDPTSLRLPAASQ
jgi:predicted ester cyclase